MPIKQENLCRYPKNWKTEIRPCILERARNKCEFCGAEDKKPHPITGSKVVLTIAHLDHTPENCDYDNLRALCQKCHNKYDAKHRAETRTISRRNKMNKFDLIITLLQWISKSLEDFSKKNEPFDVCFESKDRTSKFHFPPTGDINRKLFEKEDSKL